MGGDVIHVNKVNRHKVKVKALDAKAEAKNVEFEA